MDFDERYHTEASLPSTLALQKNANLFSLPYVPSSNMLPAGIALTAKDAEDDTVRIENRGSQAADLSGWFIRSGRGNEVFVFPEGSVLAAGTAWTVSTVSSPEPGDFVWQDKNVWHNSKADPATLMDVYGREVSRLE